MAEYQPIGRLTPFQEKMDKVAKIRKQQPVKFLSMVTYEDSIYESLEQYQKKPKIDESSLWISPPKSEPEVPDKEEKPEKESRSERKGYAPIKSKGIRPREQWKNQTEFILSCIGLCAGIGNVWRFPYLAYENGGAAFLVAYFILVIFVGQPMYFLELAWGQFCKSGPVDAFRCCSLGKGIGYAMFVLAGILCIYYNVIVSYCLLYLGHSFSLTLPWDGCEQWWLTDNSTCYDRSAGLRRCSELTDVLTTNADNETERWVFDAKNCTNVTLHTPAQLFWEQQILAITPSFENIGAMGFPLLGCFAAAWVITFFCMINGIRSSGKVVYFTTTFPYVILIILLVRGLCLEGAMKGLEYFFIPEWKKLWNIKLWKKAGEQLLFSMSLSQGCVFVYGSFNKSAKHIQRDATILSYVDFATSIIASVVVFSVLGHMSHELGLPIDKVVQQGPSLAFVTYPEALSRLWVPQLWSFLFFFMLLLLGLDSQFAMLEVLATTITDAKPQLRAVKSAVLGGTCLVCATLGMFFILGNGQYTLNLLDIYGAGTSVLFIAFFEMACLMWGYGYQRIANDLVMTLHYDLCWYWRVCWTQVAPVFLLVICIYSLFDPQLLKYGDYEYPFYAKYIGWIMTASSVGCIIVVGLYQLWKFRYAIRAVLMSDGPFWTHRKDIRETYSKSQHYKKSSQTPPPWFLTSPDISTEGPVFTETNFNLGITPTFKLPGELSKSLGSCSEEPIFGPVNLALNFDRAHRFTRSLSLTSFSQDS